MNTSDSRPASSEYWIREFLAPPEVWSSTAIIANVDIEIDLESRYGRYTLETDLLLIDDQGDQAHFDIYESCNSQDEAREEQFFENIDHHVETLERLHTRIGEYIDAVRAARIKLQVMLDD